MDMIISIGYRVKSKRGVQFRQWGESRPEEKEIIVKVIVNLINQDNQ